MTRIKVCVRTKPSQNFAQDNMIIDHEHNAIQIRKGGSHDGTPLNNKQNSFSFKFDHVFHNATQSEVYDLYARDTVQAVVDGINGAIMTYGQTGTYTLHMQTLYSHTSDEYCLIFGMCRERENFYDEWRYTEL
jgi:kinesin family protein 6/9